MLHNKTKKKLKTQNPHTKITTTATTNKLQQKNKTTKETNH